MNVHHNSINCVISNFFSTPAMKLDRLAIWLVDIGWSSQRWPWESVVSRGNRWLMGGGPGEDGSESRVDSSIKTKIQRYYRLVSPIVILQQSASWLKLARRRCCRWWIRRFRFHRGRQEEAGEILIIVDEQHEISLFTFNWSSCRCPSFSSASSSQTTRMCRMMTTDE